jgi:predicted heme/steroid binding protein
LGNQKQGGLKTMEKMTRKSYKRRRIILGVCLFASVSLIATGFAAWVISANANKTSKGNVTVGAVDNTNITISDITLSNPSSFAFEPLKTDTVGRVRYDGTNSENLSITLTASVTPAAYVKDITVAMTVPGGVTAAATANYIVLPDCVTAAQTLTEGTGLTKNGTSYDISYTIAFTWGSYFGTHNPGVYYDEDTAGKAVSDADVVTQLNDFYTTMGTLTSGFEITLTAEIN